MNQTTYHVEHMDCAAEEQLVRMALEEIPGVERLVFDLPARRLAVYHTVEAEAIWSVLDGVGLGARITGRTLEAELPPDISDASSAAEKQPLVWALAINATLFVGELVAGILAGSMGLVADALDMLADALVYALSLAAVGGSVARKKRLAGRSGYLQLGLAGLGVIEVLRRVGTSEGMPDVATMIFVAAVALVGNVVTLAILSRTKRGEAHVEASWIFTSNDVKVNALVIVSAVLVSRFNSQIPDLLAGAFIFLIVANGARRILALSK